MESEDQKPKVGVGIMVFKDGKILIGKRKEASSHGIGEYSFPGGSLEYMEGIEECAKREVLEETGIKIKNIKFKCLANVKTYTPKHVILVGLVAEWEEGIPLSLESEKIDNWTWCDPNNLPKPLFKFTEILVNSHKTGQNYFDFE